MKTKIALVFGVAGMLAGQAAHAEQPWATQAVTVNKPDPKDLARTQNGRVRKTDEAHTNEQAVVAVLGDGKSALSVHMRTGALDDGTTPPYRVQAACSPITLTAGADGAVTAVKAAGERFITDNNGNEYRNGHKPQLTPINGGKNMLVTFNYQPQGTNDTVRWAKVLDAKCNEVPITDGKGQARKQVPIMAKENDDCDMHQSGEGPCDVATDANGQTHLTCWAGCNGNGQDDGWINDVTVKCQNGADGAATGCQIVKNFDASLAQREERSRGRCTTSDADPNTAICGWTEGNNQPQRDGVWIAAVDISANGQKGGGAQSRVLWKNKIAHEAKVNGLNTYAMRMNTTRILKEVNGKLEKTDMLVIHYGLLIGNNNTEDGKGGRMVQMNVGVATVGKAGMKWVIPATDVTSKMLGIDGTHLTMSGTMVQDGDKLLPGISFLQGSQIGGGQSPADLKVFAFDLTKNTIEDYGTHGVLRGYDRHLYSNYLGGNPGEQGRNFAGSALVPNPFYSATGASKAKYLMLHALTGKASADLMNAAIKPEHSLTLTPMYAKGIATASAPGMNSSGGGQNAGVVQVPGQTPAQGAPSPGTPAETPADTAGGGQYASSGGCSTSGGGQGGLFFLLVSLGLAAGIRRRRA